MIAKLDEVLLLQISWLRDHPTKPTATGIHWPALPSTNPSIEEGLQMPGPWDASIKLVYATYANTFFTMHLVNAGEPFDVIADVEVGENLNEVVDSFDLWVSIRNLSQFTIALRNQISQPLTPTMNEPGRNQIRVGFTGGWKANEGDVLQALAVYKVSAGMTKAYTSAESDTFIVSA